MADVHGVQMSKVLLRLQGTFEHMATIKEFRYTLMPSICKSGYAWSEAQVCRLCTFVLTTGSSLYVNGLRLTFNGRAKHPNSRGQPAAL